MKIFLSKGVRTLSQPSAVQEQAASNGHVSRRLHRPILNACFLIISQEHHQVQTYKSGRASALRASAVSKATMPVRLEALRGFQLSSTVKLESWLQKKGTAFHFPRTSFKGSLITTSFSPMMPRSNETISTNRDLKHTLFCPYCLP